MRWRVYVLKAVGAGGQVSSRLSGGVGGVIVEDDANGAIGWIVCVQILEQQDEFRASVPFFNPRRDMPVVQIQRRQNRPGSKAPVLGIAGNRGMLSGHRGQVRRGSANSLHT